MNIQPQYYFSYGSNLKFTQLKKRCPSAEIFSKAKKHNHKLCFPIVSKKRENMGVASIKRSRGNAVEGVIYRISNNDLKALDKFEANGHRYARKKVFVYISKSKIMLVWTYVAISDHLENHPPSDSYLALIISGAKEHDLSNSYINKLKKG